MAKAESSGINQASLLVVRIRTNAGSCFGSLRNKQATKMIQMMKDCNRQNSVDCVYHDSEFDFCFSFGCALNMS